MENVVESNDPARAKRAQQLLLEYPQLTEAAKATFSPESIAKSVQAYGEQGGVATERSRLMLYRALATPADYEAARANVDAAATSVDARSKQQEEHRAAAARMLQEQRAEAARKRLALRAELASAAERARYHCATRDECQKAFSLTQVFIARTLT